jgi:L-fuculose-phosphate aldolase
VSTQAEPANPEELYRQFRHFGHEIYRVGLISSHGGNISVRLGNRLIIKRRGAMLGFLRPDDLIETGVHEDDEHTPSCSSELIVHRAIYRATPALAVVHTHPRTAVALSLDRAEIVPLDSEGGCIIGTVPVVVVKAPSGSPEVARAVAEALRQHPIVVVRTHGSFAAAETLERAFQYTSILEESCEIVWKAELLRQARDRP